MVPDGYIPPIRFTKDDVPELPEIPGFDLQPEREAEQRRKEETVRWLEEHCPWQPFGDVW